jgi:hypothetical protein
MDQAGAVLLDKKLTALPLREPAIRDATVKYYNDPYPCVIRRSAVMKTMFAEIEDMFRERPLSDPAAIETLPERFSCLADLPENAAYVSAQN